MAMLDAGISISVKIQIRESKLFTALSVQSTNLQRRSSYRLLVEAGLTFNKISGTYIYILR